MLHIQENIVKNLDSNIWRFLTLARAAVQKRSNAQGRNSEKKLRVYTPRWLQAGALTGVRDALCVLDVLWKPASLPTDEEVEVIRPCSECKWEPHLEEHHSSPAAYCSSKQWHWTAVQGKRMKLYLLSFSVYACLIKAAECIYAI